MAVVFVCALLLSCPARFQLGSSTPLTRFTEHTAAVKAIAWSPHQHGLLASGGGTADRCIRFWNTSTNAMLNCVDTGSQVRQEGEGSDNTHHVLWAC